MEAPPRYNVESLLCICFPLDRNGACLFGIAECDLPHIFERFFRVDKARQTEFSGAGLGLPVVKHVIEAHSGRLDMSSIPQQGTTVRVILPLTPALNPALAAEN